MLPVPSAQRIRSLAQLCSVLNELYYCQCKEVLEPHSISVEYEPTPPASEGGLHAPHTVALLPLEEDMPMLNEGTLHLDVRHLRVTALPLRRRDLD